VGRVTRMLTVGELSRLTHLPVKTLHHYHEVGVLVPADVDPVTGYRRYAPSQVATAHLARRLRDVRMPLDEVRALLATDDPAVRESGIAAHLDRLQRELTETATAVASLRALLTGVDGPAVTVRDVAAQPAVALTGGVTRDDIAGWFAVAYPRIFAAMGRAGAAPAGPGGALYDERWFADGGGDVTAYVPVTGAPGPATAPGAEVITLPAARLAVALHEGPFEDLDLTYWRLGRHVLDAGLVVAGPVRETYLVSPADTRDAAALRTEIGWPVCERSS
jgi:DNA-binding transcriptional MerR regulator/effector-binding domain-containing protein